MKLRPHVLILLFLGASSAMETACTTAPPANTNQPSANANANQPSVNANAKQSNSAETRTSEQPNQSTTGTIEVSSVPPGARVLLIPTDGDTAGEPQPKGSTPTMISGIQPGKYTVDLEKVGYRFFQKEIVVKKGSTTKVSAALRKK